MRRPTALLAAALQAAACGPGGEAAGPALPPPRVDHHVHLLSPELVSDWKSLGVPFSRPDTAYTRPSAAVAAGGPERMWLVSMAHLYGSPGFRDGLGLDEAEERRRVRREHDHLARAVRAAGAGVAGFCSVALLRPYAAEELRRCGDTLGLTGVKLHLAASGVALRDAGHLRRVEVLVDAAEAAGRPILLHLDPQRRGTEAADVRAFLETVLTPHPDAVVVVAHLGGSGGYGTWTRQALGAISDWLGEVDPGGTRPVRLDLSAVVLAEESEGVPATTAAEARRLADDLRRVGLERIVFGTDYPVFRADAYAALLAARVPLTGEEWATVMDNAALPPPAPTPPPPPSGR